MDKVLSRVVINALMVECATTKHKEVIIKATNAKKHIFTDKALALTVSDCMKIFFSMNINLEKRKNKTEVIKMTKNNSNNNRKDNKPPNIKATNSITADPDPNMHKPTRGLPKK